MVMIIGIRYLLLIIRYFRRTYILIKKVMGTLLSKLSITINVDCISNYFYSSHAIEVDEVVASITKLKVRNSDGGNNIRSDTLINACGSLFTYISLSFSTLLKHGLTPDNTVMAILIPIHKHKRKC